MNYGSKTNVVKEIREFLYLENTEHWWGVTLTMKQVVDGQRNDNKVSGQNLRHFLNILNKKVYGNSFRRFNRKIEVIPALEWSESKRLHYHLAMRSPTPDRPMLFEVLIQESWKLTKWGYNEIHTDYLINNGWVVHHSFCNFMVA